ncbi:four-carbon acid sugar kinase family protein [Paenibacillus sp. CGMCC 1.16610]|uniref:Four-carbon acid sugar kinase family protein n=1 Tax=Paenibacillus anseongense TaxID=2682845 RepID=A0ABW9U129_9BACL|nr:MULTISPECIES: four-carbon acid sugar kinase family protein [Paenibacillus]MBA2943299.1 four-carbon acid sugar kinase family protein [Paenibacillus sp. CGMCC 1.16610]MVQ33797.1 four-carbon acid sugar kinase family protein [Paenibacillus anseongense]
MEDTPFKQVSASGRTARRPLCYYGDDFTGSTDVLESLFQAGLKTVLFLEPPTPEVLQEQFQDVDCFGVAGVGRSLTPEEMERELRPLFMTLKVAGAAVVHYKICSTFDSSPGTGSIGKAAEIGREVFGGRYIPLLVGVPYLGRYTLFGNHFAAGGAGGTVHRLDRHPTMSKHPVTPMAESDLRKHLAQQTALKTALLDIKALDGSYADVRERLETVIRQEQPDLLLFDVLDEQRLEAAGRMIWEEAAEHDGLFVIGSSGVEYALGAVWRKDAGNSDAAADSRRLRAEASQAGPLLVVSGSCSPITEVQIGHALQAGFAGIRVPMEALLSPETRESAKIALQQEAQHWLAGGRSVIVYSATGPNDESIGRMREVLCTRGIRAEDSSRLLGQALGELTKELVRQLGISRVLIAGGDTSGYVTRELGVYALECISILDPGGPLCRAYANEPSFDGLELVLKGGQVGGVDFFERVAGYRYGG